MDDNFPKMPKSSSTRPMPQRRLSQPGNYVPTPEQIKADALFRGLLGMPPSENLSVVDDGVVDAGNWHAAGEGVGLLAGLFSLPALARGLLSAPGRAMIRASKSPRIYDPTPRPQRPFNVDYPQASAGDAGSRLTVDIDGRPLSDGAFVAGRRMVGGMDEGIATGDVAELSRRLGIPSTAAARTGPELKGDAGRFVGAGENSRIYLDKALTAESAPRVMAHETAHAIDYNTFGQKIPTDGLQKELAQLYSDLNSSMRVAPGKIGATPQINGYRGDDVSREYMAEAIRAYMRDPNYIKTVAPKTAARIREYVNTNPNLNRVIQFNSAGGGLLGGGLLSQDFSLPSVR